MKLTKGKYWVGDPCYVYPDEHWMDFCDRINDGPFEDKFGDKFFVFSTAYGDGGYPLKKNGVEIAELGVDAGLLSIIPFELVEKWKREHELGCIVEVESDVDIHYNNGDFDFGPYSVVTSEQDDDEEEEFEDETEEEDEE